MPLTELKEAAELSRRRRLGQYVIAALLIVIACTGLQVWMIGDTRKVADDARIQVEEVRATQRHIIATQKAGIIRGLRIRAIGCRTIQLLGGTFAPGDDCLSPEMQPYFQPNP